jgi:hypothetical protein
MRIESAIVRILAIVDKALRNEFADDFDKRCLYAAFAVFALLQDEGFDTHLAGGDFVAFVVARSGERVGLQGFGYGRDQPSHFWVEVQDTIVDLGPHYLPQGSSFAAAAMPLVAWQLSDGLPVYLRYRAHMRYDPAVQLQSFPDVMARKDRFVAGCRAKYAAQRGQPRLPSWLLTSPMALELAAREGDVWAKNALRFAAGIDKSQLPF